MPIFVYKAVNRSGRKVKGDLDAPSLDMPKMPWYAAGIRKSR